MAAAVAQHKTKLVWVATILLLTKTTAAAAADDVHCLREFKESVTDPLGYLQNWDFRGRIVNVCNFVGVSCTPGADAKPKISALDLAATGLGGRFPRGLPSCSALTDLNLSNNFFTGRIPRTICLDNPNLTKLNLSNNLFRGPIPLGVEHNCRRSNQPSIAQESESNDEKEGSIHLFSDLDGSQQVH